MAEAISITPERVLLAAILQTMSLKKRTRVLQLIGDTQADNVIRLRSPATSAERNRIVTEARHIAGVRD
jgi:hypothetical protein